MKGKIYKSVYRIEVLSDYPIPEQMTIMDIIHECIDGDYSMDYTNPIVNEILEGKKAAEAVKCQGSNPEFFGMDKDGNVL